MNYHQRITHPIAGIIYCIAGSVLIIGLLLLRTRKQQRESFTRVFPPHVLSITGKHYLLPYNSFYIAGLTGSSIYLGNGTAPSLLKTIDLVSDRITDYQIKFPLTTSTVSVDHHYNIDSPFIAVTQGLHPAVFRGSLHNLELTREEIPIKSFDAAITIQDQEMVLRTYDSAKGQNLLIKTNKYKAGTSFLLNKQMDGIFSVDGQLHYTAGKRKIIYVYYYQNRFECLDTSMQILYQAHTLDSNQMAKIQLTAYENKERVTTSFAAPPKMINPISTVNDRFVFIHSAILSNNESQSDFNQQSVVDVFYLENGNYKCSFYIPADNGQKMRAFRVTGQYLVALYENNIAVYGIRL